MTEAADHVPPAVAALQKTAAQYLDRRDVERIQQAWRTGERAHRGQFRRSGEAYIFHPVAVAQILADMAMDGDTIVAAILHDTIEDTAETKETVSAAFGAPVADIVDGVTKLDKLQFPDAREAQAESFRKMLLAMARDIRVILIKLADRLHNMRTIDAMKRPSQMRIARETLDIYAPIAQRLGMDRFRRELQDLAFRTLYPMRYRVLHGYAEQAMGRNQENLHTIGNALHARLEAAQIACTIDGRVKTPFSIYTKMKSKTMSLGEILDILGFRIVVDSVHQCYQALGVVHNLYKPRFDRFKDYIAIPKANGYQALHTVLFGPHRRPLEIQIRTREMDQVAERGIAAHWVYKLREKTGSMSTSRARDWLLGILDMQKRAGSSVDFLEHVRVDLFPDEVYVFTPQGEIRTLPRDATVLDFAYSVHTDVGDHAVQAFVDQSLAPLDRVLKSGQTIEIITSQRASPRPNWLRFVVTSKARTAIRHYLRGLEHEEAVRVGHLMLDGALADRGFSLDNISDETIEVYLSSLHLRRFEELLAEIALGNRMPGAVARQLADRSDPQQDERLARREALRLSGDEGHVVNYAACCHPIPGDKVMGYLSAGKGLVVHRKVCRNVKELRKHPDRCIDVEWGRGKDRLFKVQVRIEIHNRAGALARVASALAEAKINIVNVDNRELDGMTSELIFIVEAAGREELARIIRRIRRVRDVISVHRI